MRFYHIDTRDYPSIRARRYWYSPADKAEISRQTAEMVRAGIIEPSDSAWEANVILVHNITEPEDFAVIGKLWTR